MDNDTLRFILVAAIAFVLGLAVYLMYLTFQVLGEKMALVPCDVPAPTPPPRPRLLPSIQTFYADTEYNYVAIPDPPGHLVLAWREWAGDGYKDRALDVLLVRENGTVETLGTCVEYEVFGPPPPKVIKED